MAGYIQMVTTFPEKGMAERVSALLMERGLAACVQLIENMDSTYRWKGKVERTKEVLCLLKTRESLFSAVERVIRECHSYEVPQIVAYPLVLLSEDYEKWLDEVIFVKNLDKKA